jgi:hypothetical protein
MLRVCAFCIPLRPWNHKHHTVGGGGIHGLLVTHANANIPSGQQRGVHRAHRGTEGRGSAGGGSRSESLLGKYASAASAMPGAETKPLQWGMEQGSPVRGFYTTNECLVCTPPAGYIIMF